MTDHICAHIQNLSFISSTFNAEVDDAPGQPTDVFEPAPLHWRLLFKLPSHLKRLWSHSFRKELEVLIKKIGIFTKEEPEPEPEPDEPIIPVTAKARVKTKSDGTIHKLAEAKSTLALWDSTIKLQVEQTGQRT